MDPTLPQPPTYVEAMQEPSQNNRENQHGSPQSLNSSQSEITVGSDHQSDDSSSSDEGSAWGNYAGDGEGRRGRRERHESSESEGFNHRRQRGETSNMESERSRGQQVEDERLRKLNQKFSSKDEDVVDTCVIPDGPKPGMDDSTNQVRPKAQQPVENQARGEESQNVEALHQRALDQQQSYVTPESGPVARATRAPHPKPPRYRNRQEHGNNSRQNEGRDPMSRSVGNLREEGLSNAESSTLANGALYKRNPVNRSEQNLTDSRFKVDSSGQVGRSLHRSTPNLTGGAFSLEPMYNTQNERRDLANDRKNLPLEQPQNDRRRVPEGRIQDRYHDQIRGNQEEPRGNQNPTRRNQDSTRRDQGQYRDPRERNQDQKIRNQDQNREYTRIHNRRNQDPNSKHQTQNRDYRGKPENRPRPQQRSSGEHRNDVGTIQYPQRPDVLPSRPRVRSEEQPRHRNPFPNEPRRRPPSEPQSGGGPGLTLLPEGQEGTDLKPGGHVSGSGRSGQHSSGSIDANRSVIILDDTEDSSTDVFV